MVAPMTAISRRTFTAGLGASLLRARPGDRPNIVFICSDQHSGRVMSPTVRTPNLDRLASLGTTFRNAYCASPVCVPARAAMMTGMFPSDAGSYCNSTPFDGRVPTWGNRLRDAGYFCWATGKLDLEEGRDYGFQEFKTGHGHSRRPDITSLFRAPLCYRDERKQVNGTFRERAHSDEAKVRDALNFLRNEAPRQTRPWALYAGLHLPHPAFVAHTRYQQWYPPERVPLPDVSPEYLEQRHVVFQELANFKLISTPVPERRIRRTRAAYYAMVSELDSYVGRLLDGLEKAGRLENTLVVYTSDHGEMLGEHGLWLKNVLLENAARVPIIMAGAGLPRGKIVDAPASHVDLVATLLDVAGIPRDAKLRGHSLLQTSHPGYAYSESHSEGNCTGSFMIRKGDWKYIYFSWYDPLLFNLKDDPGELHNLAGAPEFASVRNELHAMLTSLVDPDAVTERAFAEQDRRLKAMIEKNSAEEFYEELENRLGAGQARVLTKKYYRGRA